LESEIKYNRTWKKEKGKRKSGKTYGQKLIDKLNFYYIIQKDEFIPMKIMLVKYKIDDEKFRSHLTVCIPNNVSTFFKYFFFW
jgi:hypothetical protein